MSLVTLPKTLTAKTEAKAADVMADLNALASVVNGKIDGENLAESIRGAIVPPGTVAETARTSAPTGWILCQGQAVSRTTYATLFAAIGTSWGGGDGVSTFNIPDARGRFSLAPDEGVGRAPGVAFAQWGGHSRLQSHAHGPGSLALTYETASHAHLLPMFYGLRHEGSGSAYPVWNAGGSNEYSGNETGPHSHTWASGATEVVGGGNAENMPPYHVLNKMIKT